MHASAILRACSPFALLLAVSAGSTSASKAVAKRWAPPGLASDQYESSPSFTPDGREVFFVRSDTRFRGWRILWSRCVNGGWTPPEGAPFAAPPPSVEADPVVTADGTRVYYVSTRQHHGESDDLDIWYVDRHADGSWGHPQRLPEPVNSTGSELLPRPGPGGLIYFGSDRAGGFGQTDIYVATPGGEGRWQVSNLAAPVSSTANEYEAEISRDGRTLVVVADRGDRSHLYRYELEGGRWVERGRIPAAPDVFQVGPLLSPQGDRLLFAQEDGERSGELFEIDLSPNPVAGWPPRCGKDAPTDE